MLATAAAAASSSTVRETHAYHLLKRISEAHVAAQNVAKPTPSPSPNNTAPPFDADLLQAIYDELDDTIFFSRGGFKIPKAERSRIDATGGDGAAAYGEILPQVCWVFCQGRARD